jgi:structure-specific recognition protein 1
VQLYPLDRGFFYVHKPPLLIPDNDIESVEFARQGSGAVSSSVRTFDLVIRLKGGTEHMFRYERRRVWCIIVEVASSLARNVAHAT